MSLVGNPIPPLDHMPHAGGSPPGVHLHLDAYSAEWRYGRPTIRPQTIVVHTNGGSGEGSYAGAIGWSNGGNSRTHAHYNLNAPTPSKNLRSDKRGIGNSTPRAKEIEYGVADSSFWSLVIETADRGYLNGGGQDLGDFLYDHDELVARIIAYEAIVWDIPIEIPKKWTDPGVVCHVEPFDGVFTIYTGKSCPGLTKRDRVLRGDILPRAREIFDAWTGNTPDPFPLDPPVEIPMHVLKTPRRIFDSRNGNMLDGTVEVVVPAGMLPAEALLITVTAVRPSGKGYLSVGATSAYNGSSCLNYNSDNIANTTAVRLSDGKFMLFASEPTHLLVDVVGRVL